MYLPYNNLFPLPNLANFESFRKALSHIYTLLSRLTSGKTYLDTDSIQSCITPLLFKAPLSINKNLVITSPSQIANVPKSSIITTVDANGLCTTKVKHGFIVGMPVKFNNIVYWIKTTPSDSTLTISRSYGGDTSTIILFDNISYPDTYEQLNTIKFAYPLTQIEESYYTAKNSSYTHGTGELAYGDIHGTDASTLFYNNGSTYKQVKLGFDGGSTYYNPGKTYPQAHTGWCHGMGDYKIVTSSDAIKIKFSFIQTKEDVTTARSIVPGVRMSPSTGFNLQIQNLGVGLNGIDAGLIEANKGYYVYFLYNPNTDTYGGILSLRPDKPTPFPIDTTTATYYNSFQRLGWIQTDSVGAFKPSIQINGRFCFIDDPGVTSALTFFGAGTSSAIPLLTAGYSSSSKYPYSYFLKAADVLVSFNGTGVNTNNQRIITMDNVPTLAFNSDITKSNCFKYTLNDYRLSGTNIDFKLSHPQDNGVGTIGGSLVTGTDFTSMNLSFAGFNFDMGALQV